MPRDNDDMDAYESFVVWIWPNAAYVEADAVYSNTNTQPRPRAVMSLLPEISEDSSPNDCFGNI
jgi:hypothetical protein